VVVRWSRARKRYERIGTLVEPAALAKAREVGGDGQAATTDDDPIPYTIPPQDLRRPRKNSTAVDYLS
jgi:hypothetical protein